GRPAGGADPILVVAALGERDDLGEDFHLFVDPGTAAEDDVDRLLEIEQPERQLEIARSEHLRPLAEALAVFVVGVDEEDAQVRPRLQDRPQDEHDPARFADAGGAEYGEML